VTRAGWLRLALIFGAAALLEIFCRAGVIDHRIVIPPSEMVSVLLGLLGSGQLNADLVRTLGTVAAAVALSAVFGFAAGAALYNMPRLRRLLDPFFATFYAVPIFIFYPLMIVLFGLSVLPIVVIGFASAAVAVVIATLNGLDRVPRAIIKTGRVHRMGPVATALRLRLPAAAPHLFAGIKLAVSYGFVTVIASEFILAPAGLGHDLAFAYDEFDNRTRSALIVLLLTISIGVNALLDMWDRRLARRFGRIAT
jgi:NitT/TauT family transport system permease protein